MGRRLARTPEWNATAGVDNLGWRDQHFFGAYERTGRFKIHELWNEIPQFYSVDTRTPFTGPSEGVLTLDDAAQEVKNFNVYVPISPQFDLRERRDIGTIRASATPTTHLDLTGGFTTTKHSGELPWGASFGFSNDNEVALPYNSRTNDLDIGAQWTNTRAMIRGAYGGSWFNNLDDTLTWDNPLVLTDSTSASGRGRTALWPSNSVQTLSTAGYAKFARRTQVTGSLAFGWWNNDETLLPVHDQQRAAPAPAATRDRRGRSSYHQRERQPCVTSARRLAVQHTIAPLRLQQRQPGDCHPAVHQLRHVSCNEHDRRPGPIGP